MSDVIPPFQKFAVEIGAKALRACEESGIPLGDTAYDAELVPFFLQWAPIPLHPSPHAHVELAEQLHWMTWWARFGFPTFQLTEGLCSALLLTECRGLRGRDFRRPFPSFLIALPSPSPFRFDSLHGGLVEARWLVMHTHLATATKDDARLQSRAWQRFCAGLRDGLSPLQAHEKAKEVLSRVKYGSHQSLIRLIGSSQEAIYYRWGLPDEDEPVERWIARPAKGGDFWGDPRLHKMTTSLDMATLGAACRLVVNLSMYLAEHPLPPPVSGGSKSKKAKKEGKLSPPSPKVWVVGQEIKLPRELREAARAYAERGKERAQHRITARYVVRGHWRHQAVGPRKKDPEGRYMGEHKKVWIQPFWKGPGLAGVMRLYDVATREERKS